MSKVSLTDTEAEKLMKKIREYDDFINSLTPVSRDELETIEATLKNSQKLDVIPIKHLDEQLTEDLAENRKEEAAMLHRGPPPFFTMTELDLLRNACSRQLDEIRRQQKIAQRLELQWRVEQRESEAGQWETILFKLIEKHTALEQADNATE